MSANDQHTIAYCESIGMTAGLVERTTKQGRRVWSNDLYGIFDVLAFDDEFTYGIQCCRAADCSTRKRKILAEPRGHHWVRHPARRILIHGWRRDGRLREIELMEEDFGRSIQTSATPGK